MCMALHLLPELVQSFRSVAVHNIMCVCALCMYVCFVSVRINLVVRITF